MQDKRQKQRVSLTTWPGGPEINESDYVWCFHLNKMFRRNYLPIIMGKKHMLGEITEIVEI